MENENQQLGENQTNVTPENTVNDNQQFSYGQNTYEQQNAYGQNAYEQNPYGQNAYGQNFNGTQPPFGTDGQPLKNRFGMKLAFSILEMITLLSCNLLTGIMGIIACVFNVKANSAYQEGRWDDFKSKAKTSAILLWVGLAGAVIEVIIWIVVLVFGVSMIGIANTAYQDGNRNYFDEGQNNVPYIVEEESEVTEETEETEEKKETPEKDTETKEDSASTTVVEGAGYTDPTVTINGNTVTFPLSYAEFKALGFHISGDDEASELENGYYTSTTLYNAADEEMGYCYLSNRTEGSLNLSDCMVYGVSITYDSYYDVTTDVTMPTGVTMSSTKEDWLAAYGTPDYEYESDEYDSQEYTWYAHNDAYYDDYQNSLEVSFWDGEIDEIDIRFLGWE